jgi:hypothetical protein
MFGFIQNQISPSVTRTLGVSLMLISATPIACASNSETLKPSEFSRLPEGAKSSVSAVLGRDAAAYNAESVNGGFSLESHSLKGLFTRAGVQFAIGEDQWNLEVVQYGHGETLKPADAASPQSDRNRVEYRRGSLTEWYENGPLGLEQGFTLATRDGKHSDQPLTLAFKFSGTLKPALDATSKNLKLIGRNGPRLNYAGLSVTDAKGTDLHAWFELRGDTLLVRVADADAIYPLTIDPWVQVAELTSSDGPADAGFASSVAIDGNTIVIGAEYATVGSTQYEGAAYVLVEPASGWANATQTAKLTASDGAANSFFGSTVAISGNTIIVGAPDEESNGHYDEGAAYIFVEPAGGWTDMTQTAELKRPYSDYRERPGKFGVSVAIDGDTAVVGWVGTYAGGHVYVFVEPAGGWENTSDFTGDLTPIESYDFDGFGCCVAIDGDTIIAAGGVYGRTGPEAAGTVDVFVKPTGGWTTMTQTATLTPSITYIKNSAFGYSLAIRNGTIVVGAPYFNSFTLIGTAYIYVEPPGGWVDMTETAQLKASDSEDREFFGSAVAIDGSGQTVWIGAPDDNSYEGAVYVFVKPTKGWATTNRFNTKLVGGVSGQYFGASLSISGDTELIGAPYTTINGDAFQGAAYIYEP